MKFLCFTVLLLSLLLVSSTTPAQVTAGNADIVVALDGSGDFTKIQDAIDAVANNSDRTTTIYIKRGTYNTEKLIVPSEKKNIALIGESRDETIISYHIYDCSAGKCPTEDVALWTGDNITSSATLTVLADNFKVENMTIRNTAGPVGQAQALTIRGDKNIFINCNLLGYQDTIWFWNDGKRCYFKNCLISGRTDYIYGGGIAFFEACEIRSYGGGWITAPSTAQSQTYGFVFSNCNVTYASGSPRAGDDGQLIRLGRPWHNYPKVAWLYCQMTEMINPEGWGDTWNMDYASTSTDLHLYEYLNTGAGADMSGRAAWVGLRSLTTSEAENYTAQKVLAGIDNWDPTAEAPLVTSYEWIGTGTDLGWLAASNWNPEGTPAAGELATVSGKDTIEANGGTFSADLNLNDTTKLFVSGVNTVNYMAVNGGKIQTATAGTLGGKIATKDSVIFNIAGTLTLDAQLTGVHKLIKQGSGRLILNADNSAFSGAILVEEGQLEGATASSLGKGDLQVSSTGELIVSNNNAFLPTSSLSVQTGAKLSLNATLTTSEFFIEGSMQAVGTYNSTTTPDLISGTGSVLVGRPDVFTFTGAISGTWDEPGNFTPALMPEAGETVECSIQIETTSTVFPANLNIHAPGNIRMRGDHSATGTITMDDATNLNYNTGGTGMSLNAPLTLNGDIELTMESGNSAGSALTLGGPISGTDTITPINNGKGTVNTGTLVLNGDNSNFTGVWNLSSGSKKYPSENYITEIEGKVANAFGAGKIVADKNNRVIFANENCAGDKLTMDLLGSSKAKLTSNVFVQEFILNGTSYTEGSFSATSNPDYFEGAGTIYVGNTEVEEPEQLPAFPGAEGHGKYVTGGRGGRVIYVTNLEDNSLPGSLRYAVEQLGARIVIFQVSGTIQLKSELKITNPDITIAGQTAPGDGITIRDYPVVTSADNIIIRFMRFRMGDAAQQEADALGGRFHKNIIVDHCSMSWSTDECVSFYQNENFSLQWSIISESLRNSVHDKGAHGYGGVWGGKNASFHHNLLAHHDSRNPRLGEYAGDIFALTDNVDLRNNVIYNWGNNSCYGAEGMNVNIVNCYYKPGPATAKTERIIAIDKNTVEGTAVYDQWGKFYIDGNVMTASERATSDNWTYGVYNQYHSKYGTVSDEDKAAMKLDAPHPFGEVTTQTAEIAYAKILQYGGASLVRDAVDTRVLSDVKNGNATYMDGGNGSTNGIIDTQTAVGGWPVLNSLPARTDTDLDGMPDDWENANSLDPNDANDAQLKSVDGIYPNIEVYINSLVADIVENQNTTDISTGLTTLQKQQDTFIAYFNNSTNQLNLQHDSKIRQVELFDITGKKQLIQKPNGNPIYIQLSKQLSGVYIIRILDEENNWLSQKIMIANQ
ncbi:pectinesterase family protein [Mangrovibacterium diazotrophicum]|uniref:Putative secreted protein (Por secretion system target) n=1 Tax=Mangrovibacterium diazotrophicum TaxID=1261403 RepID=A0A419VXL9_9BACT|nr:pectinesterase family protein [Mangrovibacterium diazotrophicum]RKD87968.1 putative secreted protein (Por secretion system target) [Mangrovibacterium diazotrophicum]